MERVPGGRLQGGTGGADFCNTTKAAPEIFEEVRIPDFSAYGQIDARREGGGEQITEELNRIKGASWA